MSDKKSAVAVMDLGTNTFHLLIARGSVSQPEELFRITLPVKLGEGGISSGFITPEAYQRGIGAMLTFHEHIAGYPVNRIKAVATSALRTTSNGQDFINEVKAKTGIVIETISGEQEAAYIYRGIKACHCLSHQNALILDIGGGSVEFIIGNNEQVLWKHSFEIGSARLMDKFHRADPIPPQLVAELDDYLEIKLEPLFETAAHTPVNAIIGSSGAFETFAELIERNKGHDFDLQENTRYNFNTGELLKLISWLERSAHFERENTKGIIPVRVDMIVVAALLTRFVMKKLDINEVIMSTCSLKEGVMAEMLQS